MAPPWPRVALPTIRSPLGRPVADTGMTANSSAATAATTRNDRRRTTIALLLEAAQAARTVEPLGRAARSVSWLPRPVDVAGAGGLDRSDGGDELRWRRDIARIARDGAEGHGTIGRGDDRTARLEGT